MTPSDYVCKYMLSCLDSSALDLVYHNCHMRYVFQRKCRSPFFVPYLSFPMWTKRWIYYIYYRTFCWHMKLSAAHLHPHIQHENTIIQIYEPEMVLDGNNAMEYIYIPYKPYSISEGTQGGNRAACLFTKSKQL